MFLTKPDEFNFELPPEGGPYIAVCYRFIDLGTQYSEAFQKSARKVLIGWELTEPGLARADGQPFLIAKRYTFSMHEKAQLRKDLEAWSGRPFTEADFGAGGFNTRNLLGVGCQLTIQHAVGTGGSMYANISAIMAMPRGHVAPKPVSPMEYLSLSREGWDAALFDSFSEKLKATIQEAPEFKALFGAPAQLVGRGSQPRAGNPQAAQQHAAQQHAAQRQQQAKAAQTYTAAEQKLAPSDTLDDKIPF